MKYGGYSADHHVADTVSFEACQDLVGLEGEP